MGYLASSVLFKKTGETTLDWPVEIDCVYVGWLGIEMNSDDRASAWGNRRFYAARVDICKFFHRVRPKPVWLPRMTPLATSRCRYLPEPGPHRLDQYLPRAKSGAEHQDHYRPRRNTWLRSRQRTPIRNSQARARV